LFCGIVLASHTHSVMHEGSSAQIIHRLVNTPRHQVHSYFRSALLHVCTMAVTFPLCIGVGSLLGWHVYIVLRVRSAMHIAFPMLALSTVA
jgi:hypothetical protein